MKLYQFGKSDEQMNKETKSWAIANPNKMTVYDKAFLRQVPI